MAYTIRFERAAIKALQGLPRRFQVRIVVKAEAPAENPRPAGARQLKGDSGLYRVRVGDYRVVYRVKDDVLTVVVVRIAHRKEVYRQVARKK